MLVIRPTEKLHSGDLTLKDKNKSEKIIYEDIFPKEIFSETITKIVKKGIHKNSNKEFSTRNERILQRGCFKNILDKTNIAKTDSVKRLKLVMEYPIGKNIPTAKAAHIYDQPIS